MKIALIGYGKMGKAIETIAVSKGHEIVLKINSANALEFNKENLSNADVAIEFTKPTTALGNIVKCMEWGIPVVVGTTGWLEHWATIVEACNTYNGTILYASNFSIGVNLFFELNTFLANMMTDYPQYDVSIEEIHHTEKKDAPSGTAITLAEQVLSKIKSKQSWINQTDTQTVHALPNELVITSKRIDPAPGTHTISYRSSIDDIEIIHTAHNRTGFASGAVLAAEFIAHKKGIFTMKDVLGF